MEGKKVYQRYHVFCVQGGKVRRREEWKERERDEWKEGEKETNGKRERRRREEWRCGCWRIHLKVPVSYKVSYKV